MLGCSVPVSGFPLITVCLQSWCPSVFLLSSSCRPAVNSLWAGHKSCSSSAIAQLPAIHSYLYRHEFNNWNHELLLRSRVGMKAPDHTLLAAERISLNWCYKVCEECDRESICTKDKWKGGKEERGVKRDSRAQKLQDDAFSVAWQWFHRQRRSEGTYKVKNPPRLT